MACLLSTAVSQGQRRLAFTSFVRSYAPSELGRWQRRCDRLAQLQRRIRFPVVETFTVQEQTYQLPLSMVEPTRTPSQEELEYLLGFFDGDGCVSMNGRTGQMTLAIGQNIDATEVLLQFRTLLGGASIMRLRQLAQRRPCFNGKSLVASCVMQLPPSPECHQ